MIEKIAGLSVRYRLSGQGRPQVLLLHGWGVDSDTLEDLRLHLAESCTVCSLDFPGFGQSQEPPEVWGVNEYAAFVKAFIDHLGWQQPVVFGHSFGGRVTIVLAAAGHCQKIVLCDSAGIKPRRGLSYYARVYSYKAAKAICRLPGIRRYRQRLLSLWLNANPSSDYRAAQGVMRQIFVKVVNQDLRPCLKQIAVPALLLWGALDTATPLSDAKIMEAEIADAGLVVFEQAGHYPFLNEPQRFYRIIDYFLTHQD
ncbi:MAG: alpha/beta hydrolase [Firmicutes bacterium]|nr:alpha/beta hydrolase [Bacillota bacterium]